MHNALIIFFILFWSCTSCNEDKPLQDADSIHDSDVADTAVEDDTFSD